MARVVAVANLKGGIGKTTTVVNVGAGLALKGARVLLVDTDAQGNLAMALGVHSRRTLYVSWSMARPLIAASSRRALVSISFQRMQRCSAPNRSSRAVPIGAGCWRRRSNRLSGRMISS